MFKPRGLPLVGDRLRGVRESSPAGGLREIGNAPSRVFLRAIAAAGPPRPPSWRATSKPPSARLGLGPKRRRRRRRVCVRQRSFDNVPVRAMLAPDRPPRRVPRSRRIATTTIGKVSSESDGGDVDESSSGGEGDDGYDDGSSSSSPIFWQRLAFLRLTSCSCAPTHRRRAGGRGGPLAELRMRHEQACQQGRAIIAPTRLHSRMDFSK